MTDSQKHIIGLVFYPGMTALDIVGPQEVFGGLPNVQIHRIWKTLDPVKTDNGMIVLPDTTFANCPCLDLICIGGGLGQGLLEDDPDMLAFLRKQGNTAKFIASVCGGSHFLAKAGLLQGYRAATHWAMREQLAGLGVEVGTERVVIDRNRITGGGVTAGIDFALTIARILYGEEIAKITQLLIEYNPAPPFDTGSPEKAGAELVDKAMLFIQGLTSIQNMSEWKQKG
ncbi:MAG TPA: DJ-1/PfpI family protein [Cyanobacteria bacterium UBA11149]|nr:DJ-1/PfpI family protein [Cyanobacteria bacterium UBA11367]HBE56147.1 DJ-1/PfpI family protein [Cyanobacteria bacterium UBA11366]HBK65230.1 DJ-1/PfpI family protein [Cyanobacteria bacterium UBA11166]HBR76058.1 DJ-1/PfpI family protein [Cyanobacteria bacterium UBA11159]HBS69234.1 DJ-1/PfpI family protein [Cyanobacteria bacterium UBA11153]HBW88084.1 DJ-1/PfpI family protein [Cyanobacteria bacterium UBA11149]HCA96198.1 DJ-1/PfpI family protein [Cyanobacteria bacterium UBA9226]